MKLLFGKTITTGKLICWRLRFQESSCNIVHVPESKKRSIDQISVLTTNEGENRNKPVDVEFPNTSMEAYFDPQTF